MNEYINELLKLSKKAYKNNEVPVGAIIVFNNNIIGKGYNVRTKNNDVLGHAEIIAIRKAARKLKDWRLNECDLYVTLEPCSMCKEIIKQSRIKNVYYLVNKLDYKKEYEKTSFIKDDTIDSFQRQKYKDELSTFFKDKCKR